MEFIKSYDTPRKGDQRNQNIFSLTIDEFEIGNEPADGYRLNEYIDSNKVVRPYYDYDLSNLVKQASAEEINEHYVKFSDIVLKLHPQAEIAFAERCGEKPKKGFVISLRAYVKGFKMIVSDIKKHIHVTFGDSKPDELDINVYKEKDQCLGLINAYKTTEDRRILKPLTHHDEKRAFVCQYMYGDEKMIEIEEVGPVAVRPGLSLQRANVPLKQIIQNGGIPLVWDSLIPLLSSLGFKSLVQKATREFGYNFDADRSCHCVICEKRIHESQEWFIMRIFEEMFVVKNYSPNCKARIIGWQDNVMLKNILKFPDCDSDYADVFAATFHGNLFYTMKNRYMHFEGNGWRELPYLEIINVLNLTLVGIMERLLWALNEKRLEIDLHSKIAEDQKKVAGRANKKDYDNALIGLKYVKKSKNLKSIAQMLGSRLLSQDFEDKLDTNGWLLGVNNGVIDLRTCTFRSSVVDDMVSKTTGYNFIEKNSADWNQSTMDEVTEFIKKIYPVDEEREIVQRYGGYCLLGVHPEKIFVIHTDTRKGYNGKSKYALLLSSALGTDYTMDGGNNNILYRSDVHHGTVDSHSSGMLAYEKKRLVILEELTDTRSLDNELIKKLHGGGAEYEGRQIGVETRRRFPWVTKMILNCNNKKFPKFDWLDEALVIRLTAFYHRSKFYVNKAEYEKHKHEPYTYLAVDADDKIKGEWRPYMLHWLLDGLRNYHEVRFSVMPDVCKQWNDSVVRNQDTITPWLDDNVHKTESEDDFVTKAMLYQKFKNDTPEEKVRKTCIGENNFIEKVIDIMGEPIKRKKINGKDYRSVWIQWSLASSD